MHRVSLNRSSGFRLALTFAALFLVASVFAGAAAYSIINEELRNRRQRVVSEQYDFFVAAYTAGGLDDLIEALDAYAKVSRRQDSVFILAGSDGKRIAGNLEAMPSALAGKDVAASALGISADYRYFVRQGRLDDYHLLVGASAEDISEMEEIFVEGAAWAATVLIAIALAGGVFLSLRMNRRISTIQESLERVADGHFDARIPDTGNGDDIDTLATMINSTIARLGASVESIRQISNDISHDLKTPLNRLRIVIEDALDKQANGKSVTAELEEANSETNRIIATFDALLRIAQIESGARKARFADTNVAEIVGDVAEFYRTLVEDEGMTLDVRLDRTAPIHGDRELLTQLFVNLIENALRHCSKGCEITCSVTTEYDCVDASVCDRGPGIPPPEREKVLRRLYRMEASRTTPGSGLGLSMVKAIADLHGASIVLGDNDPGLCVTLKFPLSGGEIRAMS